MIFFQIICYNNIGRKYYGSNHIGITNSNIILLPVLLHTMAFVQCILDYHYIDYNIHSNMDRNKIDT
jgi:hypothetical protein